MSYASQYALTANQTFIDRVQQVVQRCALDIQAEATSTQYHAQRGAWAQWCLKNPGHAAKMMVCGVVADDVTTDAATDSALYNRVSAIWNAYALVT